MLDVIAGPDARDSTSLPADGAGHARALRAGIKGLRVAWSPTLGLAPAVDREVAAATERAARVFRELGCRVERVEPRWPSPYQAWRSIFFGGIATRLAPYRERREEIDAGLLAIVEEGLRMPPTRFVEAWFERLAWWPHVRALFDRYDLLLTPTVACPPLPLGQLFATRIAGKPVGPEASSVFTFIFNMTGQPAASVPCGFTRTGLPIGLQIVGRRFADIAVLQAAAAFERARPWAQVRPAC
jgi:aspartyl-tRNA(Asn)/glutamyl-tRNA(Gln) amidotransferase subunit A